VVAGLDATSGTAGRFVTAGGVLGRMAADREPELYLEVRKDGAPVDPARWLRPSSLAQADG
jgi:septal ring factor EnvC (AmiA/AmiB activator)